MHVIDGSSKGADGIELADINGDGLPDITTGWEEGGRTMVYLNPGFQKSKQPWPSVMVGKTTDAEDAVFADLDGDGNMDVITATEGITKKLFVHWGPPKDKLLDPDPWRTEVLPASDGMMRWMFCIPAQIDGKNGIDLIAGGKQENGQVGWFESPTNPQNLKDWKWHSITPAKWTMSLVALDMDKDGDVDILMTDRYGSLQGVHWLENAGNGTWVNHPIGAKREMMFLDSADLNNDGLPDIAAISAWDGLFLFYRKPGEPPEWQHHRIVFPEHIGMGKGIGIGDINRDGKNDLVLSFEQATGDKSGLVWLSGPDWKRHEISGTAGTKYDVVKLVDLDGDGDLDVISTEEIDNLGVIWFENPTIER